MPDEIALRPIGTVTGGRDEWVEDHWYGVKSVIRLDSGLFDPGVVLGLTGFSHLEVVFYFDRIDPSAVRTEPVLDVKPYMVEFAPRDPVTQPTWSTELMHDYY
jgi:tRNA (adenine37-N6)-methyltransferase